MTGPSSASPQCPGSRRLRASIFFAVYAEIAFLVFLGVFLWRHANPNGGGMEMVGLSAALMLIFLPLTLPAWILAKQGRFLLTAAFIAAFAAILYFLLWLELLDEVDVGLPAQDGLEPVGGWIRAERRDAVESDAAAHGVEARLGET